MSDPNSIWYYLGQSYNWDLSRPQSIPNLLFDHLYITGVSMLIALIIAFPLALLATRYERIYLPMITAAGVIYAIPSLALLGFMVFITGLTDATLIIPLVAYAQIVLIRNIVTAIRSVDPSLLEVGRAMGMNEVQLLWRVTLPLALPVIIAGIRLAAVTTIGIASIGPLVAVDNLGDLIFQGINPIYTPELITAAVIITLLALVVDGILLGVQSALSRGRTVDVAR